jgi:hypothetical protein
MAASCDFGLNFGFSTIATFPSSALTTATTWTSASSLFFKAAILSYTVNVLGLGGGGPKFLMFYERFALLAPAVILSNLRESLGGGFLLANVSFLTAAAYDDGESFLSTTSPLIILTGAIGASPASAAAFF